MATAIDIKQNMNKARQVNRSTTTNDSQKNSLNQKNQNPVSSYKNRKNSNFIRAKPLEKPKRNETKRKLRAWKRITSE